MILFLKTGQYFGTSLNGIEDNKSETEGVIIIYIYILIGFKVFSFCTQ